MPKRILMWELIVLVATAFVAGAAGGYQWGRSAASPPGDAVSRRETWNHPRAVGGGATREDSRWGR